MTHRPADFEECAPDAGDSYLGHYGLGPWGVWLLNRAPELMALRPSELRERDAAPTCPACRTPMRSRPGRWTCYRHEAPVTVVAALPLSRAPEGRVLHRTGEVLETLEEPGRLKL